MLTAKNLERMIALEDKLRTEYQAQLDAKAAEIESCIKEKDEQTALLTLYQYEACPLRVKRRRV